MALIIFQIGSLVSTGVFTLGSFAGILAVVLFLYLLFRPNRTQKLKVYGAKASKAA